MEDLRVKLEKEGFLNISYVVVNHQGLSSQLKYMYLKNKVSEHIPVYQQEENQTDVWTLLNGKKDDFLIYDRCGRLVYHLGLPYSFLTFPYVEEAIKRAYCEEKCGNCSLTGSWKMKRSVKWYLQALWKAQLRLPSHIPMTTTFTIIIIIIIITSIGISLMRMMSFQRISNQKNQMFPSILHLKAFIATISTRTTRDRATQTTEICQQEVKVYNFLFHKISSDERDVETSYSANCLEIQGWPLAADADTDDI
ncbi:Selenoprotein P [Vulpes lagopus]